MGGWSWSRVMSMKSVLTYGEHQKLTWSKLWDQTVYVHCSLLSYASQFVLGFEVFIQGLGRSCHNLLLALCTFVVSFSQHKLFHTSSSTLLASYFVLSFFATIIFFLFVSFSKRIVHVFLYELHLVLHFLFWFKLHKNLNSFTMLKCFYSNKLSTFSCFGFLVLFSCLESLLFLLSSW